MKQIPLTRGLFALVDDEDYDSLMLTKWRAITGNSHKNHKYICYAGDRLRRLMHRVIMDCPKGMVVDHINHDTLDNRRANLRICTHKENLRNRTQRVNKSQQSYLGVYRVKSTNKWYSMINGNGKVCYLGVFNTPEDAALVYDMHAKVIYGEFVNLNSKLIHGYH